MLCSLKSICWLLLLFVFWLSVEISFLLRCSFLKPKDSPIFLHPVVHNKNNCRRATNYKPQLVHCLFRFSAEIYDAHRPPNLRCRFQSEMCEFPIMTSGEAMMSLEATCLTYCLPASRIEFSRLQQIFMNEGTL